MLWGDGRGKGQGFFPLFFHILIKSSLDGHRGMCEVQYPLFILS